MAVAIPQRHMARRAGQMVVDLCKEDTAHHSLAVVKMDLGK